MLSELGIKSLAIDFLFSRIWLIFYWFEMLAISFLFEMKRELASEKIREARLYGIVDAGYVALESMRSVTETMCHSGVKVLQLRAKGVEKDVVRCKAQELQNVCKLHGVVFILNDYPDLAAELKCDGVHVGQDDGSYTKVREIVGDDMLIGRSTHSVEQAEKALADGFDYIGFGPLFPTPTKKGRPGIGVSNVASVEDEVGSQIPVFCIGGVKESNLGEVLDQGARRVVIVSDILLAENLDEKISRLLSKLDQ